MKLIVGLGNPGGEYARTRHNAGFLVLDRLAGKLGVEFGQRKFRGLFAAAALPREWHGREAGDGKLLLVKPQTYMNLSGQTVAPFVGYYKLPLAAVLVVADDVALPPGQLRLRRDGSAGGHKGLLDIEAALGSQAYARLRVGMGGREAGAVQPIASLTGHVLGRLAPDEEERLAPALERACEVCLYWAGHGVEVAMNRHNAPPLEHPRDGSDQTGRRPDPGKRGSGPAAHKEP